MIKYLKIKILKKLIISKIYYILFILIMFYKKKLFLKNKSKNDIYFDAEKKQFSFFSSLKLKPLDINNTLLIKEKKDILLRISEDLGKNITSIDKIIITSDIRFGNLISLLNKFIFCCEIIGCKSIVLDKKYFWFIKKKINISTNNCNYTIESDDISKYVNNSFIILYKASNFFFYFFNIKPQIRIHFLIIYLFLK